MTRRERLQEFVLTDWLLKVALFFKDLAMPLLGGCLVCKQDSLEDSF